MTLNVLTETKCHETAQTKPNSGDDFHDTKALNWVRPMALNKNLFLLQVLGPFKADEAFISEDFTLLEKYTNRVSGEKIAEKLAGLGKNDDEWVDLQIHNSQIQII